MALIGGAAPSHMTRQGSATLGVGIHRFMGLPLTLPIQRIVAELNRFQPQYLNAYPSVAARLAEEQLAGRLRLSLTMMSTSSELRTPEMNERLVEAFGVRPFDCTRRPRGYGASSANATRVSTSSRT